MDFGNVNLSGHFSLSAGNYLQVIYFSSIQRFFENPITFILISSIAFAYMHIIFGNNIAPLLTLFGVLMFSVTFYDSGSIIMSSFELALWGDLLFTIDLGKYFYSVIKKLEFIKNNAGDV